MSPSVRVKKLSLFRALDRYLDTVSVHKRGYQQEFWRVSVIKRHPVAQKMMDEVTTVDIASYRDERLSQVNPRTGKLISGNTVRLELALLSALYNLAKVEWGTCRTNPVEMVRKPKPSPGRDRRLTSSEERRLSPISRRVTLNCTPYSIWPWKQGCDRGRYYPCNGSISTCSTVWLICP